MSEAKVCTKCGVPKDLSSYRFRGFRKDGSERRESWCRSCLTAYTTEKRRENASYRKVNRKCVKRSQRALKEDVNLLKSVPCSDCGNTYSPWVMQFDHVRGKKMANVANLVRSGCRNKAMEEIEKCEVVCANCHADRTHKRRKTALSSRS